MVYRVAMRGDTSPPIYGDRRSILLKCVHFGTFWYAEGNRNIVYLMTGAAGV